MVFTPRLCIRGAARDVDAATAGAREAAVENAAAARGAFCAALTARAAERERVLEPAIVSGDFASAERGQKVGGSHVKAQARRGDCREPWETCGRA